MLEKTSGRVEQMVRELQLLNSVAPMLMLGDAQVRQDLKLDKTKAQQVAQAVSQFQSERQSLSNTNIGTLLTDNQELSELLTEFDTFIRKQLTDQQIERLFQISRQARLPFTFKTSEVIKALQLSQSQRDAIDRIIEETRPRGPRGPGGMQDGFQRNRFAPDMNGRRPGEFGEGPREFGDGPREFREGPGEFGGPQRFGGGPGGPDFGDGPERGERMPPNFGPDDPPGFGPNDAPGFGPGGPPPDERMGFGPEGEPGPNDRHGNGFRGGRDQMDHGPMGGGNRGGFFDQERQAATKLTVKAILETLSPTQRLKWDELIGPPFEPQPQRPEFE